MPSLFALAMPAALLLPFFGVQHDGRDRAELGGESAGPAASGQPSGRQVTLTAPHLPLNPQQSSAFEAFRDDQTNQQIRIERRMVIRISPRRPQQRNELIAQLPQQTTIRYEERKMDKCVPVSGIAGVQTGSGNRLLLFMRDAGIVSMNLEKACRARDFYSGFYVEQNADGMLCIDRDRLQSRSGAKCEVERMRELVAVRD